MTLLPTIVMTFLLDTNIISELTRPKPNQNVINWSAQLSEITISVITVEEIYYGLVWKPNSRIQVWFDTFLDSKCLIQKPGFLIKSLLHRLNLTQKPGFFGSWSIEG